MFLLLDKNAVEKRAMNANLPVKDVMTGFKKEFRSEDYAAGYFEVLLDGTIPFRLLKDEQEFCELLNKKLLIGSKFEWYAHSLTITGEGK